MVIHGFYVLLVVCCSLLVLIYAIRVMFKILFNPACWSHQMRIPSVQLWLFVALLICCSLSGLIYAIRVMFKILFNPACWSHQMCISSVQFTSAWSIVPQLSPIFWNLHGCHRLGPTSHWIGYAWKAWLVKHSHGSIRAFSRWKITTRLAEPMKSHHKTCKARS
jgi:hypothetical protein